VRPSITGKALAAAVLALALLTACSRRDEAHEGVDPRDYSSFFLWSGVRPPQHLAKAESVYLLWGELRADDPSRIVALRREVPRDPGPDLWLVVRAERLDWGEGAYAQLLAEAERWRAAGNPLVGIQVDFDAATLRLGRYREFLRGLRRRMPAGLKLSATGLMDWTTGAEARDLASLGGVLDELVVQTYQGEATISGYQSYLPSLERLDLPYRVGLIEGGEWSAPPELARDPQFEGYVVFLKRT
jgi:hypothetical protein